MPFSHLEKFFVWFLQRIFREVTYPVYRGSVGLLEILGPNLPRPHSDSVKGSRFKNMKELRTQHAGRPYRTLYAFDPRRTAILLIGGNKSGDDGWYQKYVPLADKLYEHHLKELEEEEG